jgi:release factor glutamine methyltransferase
MSLSVGDTLQGAEQILREAGVAEARVNAEFLLSHLLQTDRGGLFLKRGEVLADEHADRFKRLLTRRARREPLQHVIGSQEFYGLEFLCDSRALIPRPETELLVDSVLQLDPPQGGRVVDLGTGSGCVAIALAVSRPDLQLIAIDASAEALALAATNAKRQSVADRIRFVEGDFGEPSNYPGDGYDVVVSNPPYVSEREWTDLEPEVRDHDPKRALVPGASGLEAYRRLIPVALKGLRDAGQLVLEVGAGQADAVSSILGEHDATHVERRLDFRQVERVLIARKELS